MDKTRSEVREESRRKGVAAGATTAGAVVLAAVGWPIAAVITAVPAAILVRNWWKHRLANGIRF
jgi:hypothetical protein